MLKDSTRIAVVALALLSGSLSGAAQHQHQTTMLAVGDHNDEITLTKETRIADITLKPGRYYIDHRVEGTARPRRVEAHYIHFTEVTPDVRQRRQAARNALKGSAVAHPGDIECALEALTKPASKTTVVTTDDNGVPRITRIEIAGENVAHIF
jgi:hypothetical protein